MFPAGGQPSPELIVKLNNGLPLLLTDSSELSRHRLLPDPEDKEEEEVVVEVVMVVVMRYQIMINSPCGHKECGGV